MPQPLQLPTMPRGTPTPPDSAAPERPAPRSHNKRTDMGGGGVAPGRRVNVFDRPALVAWLAAHPLPPFRGVG
jgi:hypothetical protein